MSPDSSSAARLYAAVAIAWLALVFVWFAVTVLRDRSRRFVGGAFISGFAVLALLYAVNPALLVTRYNLSHPPRTADARTIDYAYLASLGPDAVPVLLPPLLSQPSLSTEAGAAAPPGAGRLVRKHANEVFARSCPE